MPRRKTPLVRGEYYHLYNRGHNRELVFREADNYVFFLRQLRSYVVPEHAAVIAYVLMPNHYHLLLNVQSDDLSRAMQRLSISFTMAMNLRYKHTGGIFEGAFGAKLIDEDAYLTHLSRYIHLNPVRRGPAAHAEDWIYSSYRDCIGLRQGSLPQPTIVLSQSGSASTYREFVESYTAPDREVVDHWLF
jgi:putative transposase